jgi:hypothetical protein
MIQVKCLPMSVNPKGHTLTPLCTYTDVHASTFVDEEKEQEAGGLVLYDGFVGGCGERQTVIRTIHFVCL